MSKIIFAIDPGKMGAIAVQDGDNISFIKMPENMYEVMNFFLNAYPEIQAIEKVCIIEQLHAGSVSQGPRKSSKVIWSQASNYANLKCALYAAGIRTEEVSPAKWMDKLVGVRPKDYAARKKWLHEKAQRLYPTLKSPKYAADALCLLHVAKELLK